jgi:hypothetical protein
MEYADAIGPDFSETNGAVPFLGTALLLGFGMVGIVAQAPNRREKGVIVFRENWLYTEFIYHFVRRSEAAAEIFPHKESGNRR